MPPEPEADYSYSDPCSDYPGACVFVRENYWWEHPAMLLAIVLCYILIRFLVFSVFVKVDKHEIDKIVVWVLFAGVGLWIMAQVMVDPKDEYCECYGGSEVEMTEQDNDG